MYQDLTLEIKRIHRASKATVIPIVTVALGTISRTIHKRKLEAWILVAISFPEPEVQRGEILLYGGYLYVGINYGKRSTVTSLSRNQSPVNTFKPY